MILPPLIFAGLTFKLEFESVLMWRRSIVITIFDISLNCNVYLSVGLYTLKHCLNAVPTQRILEVNSNNLYRELKPRLSVGTPWVGLVKQIGRIGERKRIST